MVTGLKEFARYFSKLVFKFILRIFWVFPIQNNKITLLNELSYSYGDSMKYLDIFILNKAGNKYQIVFPIREGQEAPKNGEIIVKPMTVDYFKQLLTSKVIITNAGGVSYLPKRKGQTIISTWHGGGPYKKTGTAVYKTKWYKWETLLNARNIDYIMSTCKYFSEFEAKTMLFEDSQIIPAGTPRNDMLMGVYPEIKNRVYDYCGLNENEKIVLFAPTFRSDTNDYTSGKQQIIIDIDYCEVISRLSKRFGGEWRFAVRLHPKLKNIDLQDNKIINLTNYPDMQELLYSASVVITDYSSLMWDYSLTGKPCFLYAPDIEEYERTRGFYMPVSKWPYPLAHDNDELFEIIDNFELDEYTRKLKIHHKEAGSFENGNSCEIVYNLIEE